MKKTIFFVTLMVLATTVFSQEKQVKTKLKFGHFNSSELLEKLPEFEAALLQLEDLQTNNNVLLKNMRTQYMADVQNYAAKADTMSQERREFIESQLHQAGARITAYEDTIKEQMSQKEKELLDPVIEKACTAVEAVGKKFGYTYIFDLAKGGVLYNNTQSDDITKLILKELGISDKTQK